MGASEISNLAIVSSTTGQTYLNGELLARVEATSGINVKYSVCARSASMIHSAARERVELA